MDFIDNFFEKIITSIGVGAIGNGALITVLVLFVVVFCLKTLVRRFSENLVAIYLSLSLTVCFLYRYFIGLFNENTGNWYLLIGLVFLLLLPIRLVGKKNKKSDKSKEFIKYIDQKIAEEQTENNVAKEKIALPNDEEKKDVVDGLNLSHVKNILKRLDYIDLSQSDRRQVRELETAVFQAERRLDDLEVKEKLNDGLGALLKIMAKYGV